jgi:alanyl-tRNA synthetase
LLHAALRKVLGTHVSQAGSLVDSDRLRFDFTHNKPITESELLQIEALVNHEIGKSIDVNSRVMPHAQAIASGALALFGEKYGDEVRVIKMDDFSTELCGGTHVSNTAQIRAFTVMNESGVSAGVRRIEAWTGNRAIEYLARNAAEALIVRKTLGLSDPWSRVNADDAPENNPSQSIASRSTILAWAETSKQEIKKLEREIKTLQGQKIDVTSLIASARSFTTNLGPAQLVTAQVDIDDRQVLSELTDKIKNKIQAGIVVLVGRGEDSHPIIVSVSKDLTKLYSAGNLLKEIAGEMGGKGGGRPDFAQGAAPQIEHAPRAFIKLGQLLGVSS